MAYRRIQNVFLKCLIEYLQLGPAEENEPGRAQNRALFFFFFLLSNGRKRKYLLKHQQLSKRRWGFSFQSKHIFALLADDYPCVLYQAGLPSSDVPQPPVNCTLWIITFITCQAWSDTLGQTGTLFQARQVNCLADNMPLNLLKSWMHLYWMAKRERNILAQLFRELWSPSASTEPQLPESFPEAKPCEWYHNVTCRVTNDTGGKYGVKT